MAKKKQGWEKGLGTFAHDDNSLPITNKPAQNEDGPGKSYADQVDERGLSHSRSSQGI